MTTVTVPVTATTDAPDRWHRLRAEGRYGAEIAALCGFLFARPILDSFGSSPETFISRGADGWTVLLFGLLVVAAPVLVVASATALVGVAGTSARWVAHVGVVGGLGALVVLQLLRVHTDLSTGWSRAVAVVLGVGLAAGVANVDVVRVFLRYAGVASLVFLAQFLFFSPAGSLVLGGRSAGIDPEVTAAVAEAVGDDAPPVVVIMLDAFPTAALMDGDGGIHRDVYPNLAALADDATWYRNHTTIAQDTVHAVPAALSGRVPDLGSPPVASAYPENLFTLLGGVYDTEVEEQVTALCPDRLCPHATGGSIRSLLGDARDLWHDSFERAPRPPGLPGAFGSRYHDFRSWVETVEPGMSDGPELVFYHALLPHDPWYWLPGGFRYDGSMPAEGLWFGHWGTGAHEVGLQRHVLQSQAVDELLGRLFDRMREAGTYDEALIVVTADHGAAFEPQASVRGLAESQFDQIMWTPLVVKAPGQHEAVVDDRNVLNIDVLPIVAAELGIDLADLGWEVDGIVPGVDPDRDLGDKSTLDWAWGEVRAEGREDLIPMDGREGFERVVTADVIEGSGPLAAWQRTEHGALLGSSVADLDQGDPSDLRVELRHRGRFGNVDRHLPLPLEVSGRSELTGEDVLVVAVNDTVAAVVPPTATPYGITVWYGLLWPDALVDGENDVAVFQVTGPADAPTLHRLVLVDEL